VAAGWLVLRAEFRARWRTWLMLCLIAGLFAGVVQAAAAGARRTDSAYPSLVGWSHPPDVLLFSFPGQSGTFGRFSMAAVARLPQVTQFATVASYTVADPADVGLWAPETDAVPGRFWHRKILAGRTADPARPGEVNISFTLAEASNLGVGDILRVALLGKTRHLSWFSFRIVGIDAAPAEFPPQAGSGSDIVWATPAFYREHRSGLAVYSSAAMRLRHGPADLPAVQREISHLAHGKVVDAYPLGPQAANTERSIHLQTITLWLLCGLLAVIGLLVLGQLLARMSFLDGGEYSTLLALGMSRRALFAVGLGRAAAVGAAGGACGAVLAVLASPALPVGLAGVAEPHSGIRADVTVLALGVAGTALATVAGAAWPAWRAAGAGRARARATAGLARGTPGTAAKGSRAAGAAGRSPKLAAAATAGISSVAAVIGLRLALQPGAGRTALPVRSTIASAVVGVAALTAALVFSASLGNLLATPRLYGVTWDAYVSNPFSSGVSAAARGAAADPAVAAWAVGYSGVPMTIRGVGVGAIALLPGHHGSLMPVLTQGRLPRGPGEIVLGERTMADARGHLGGTVSVSLASYRPRLLRIVGIAVFPDMDDTLNLGRGAAMTVAGTRGLLPPGLPLPPPDTLFVRFRPSAATAQARLDSFAAREARLGPFLTVGPATPADVVNFGRVQNLPLLLGAALSLLALLTIAHLLLTSVRRRRRDFAVLRALGFTRRQVRSAVSWQAGTLAAAALVIGIPAGILCGRLAWQLFEHRLGIHPAAVVPLATLGVLVPTALALAVAIAAVPGESAARTPAAQILRSE
jgi:ABC-type lipoprotein release transport system permease subunit